MPMPSGSNASAPPMRIRAAGIVETEVLVAGAGIVGLVLGIALARNGLDVVIAGRVTSRLPGRTVALLEGSIAFLETLGLWPDLAGKAEPLRVMRIVDDTGSLFRIPPVSFRAEEIGQTSFGSNITNEDLIEGLARLARTVPRLRVMDQHLTAFDFGAGAVSARCEDGREIRASLLAAADGRQSPARQAAGLTVKSWRYPQAAVTAILRHTRSHDGASTEFHTRQGPFTLVPLPGSPEASHRSSLVWVMAPDDARELSEAPPKRLAREIERQSRMLVGGVTVEEPTGCFPITGMTCDRMVGPRIALGGEAAHVIPPIGAQGLNLGLRDAAALARILAAAKRHRQDPGAPAILERYARARRGDVALRTMGVDGLNRALLSGQLPVDLLRGAGLLALAHVGPLRRLAMRAGLGANRRGAARVA